LEGILDNAASGKLCQQSIIVRIRSMLHFNDHHLLMDVFFVFFLATATWAVVLLDRPDLK
jgi:hypothetical protein